MDFNLKIVICSSWRKYPNCNELLYNSGLNSKIEVIDKTIVSNKDWKYEILNYLEKHHYIDKFIILDNGIFSELSKYQVKTILSNGFNKEKYNEASDLPRKWKKYKTYISAELIV